MRWITNAIGLSAFLLSLTLLFEAWPGTAAAGPTALEIAAASPHRSR